MNARSVVALLAVAVAFGTLDARPVQAEDWHWMRGNMDDRRRMRRQRSGIAGEHTTWTDGVGGSRVLLQSPLLGAWYSPAEKFTLSIDWGMSYYREDVAGEAERVFRFGNPLLSGYYVDHSSSIRLYIGMGLALPAATLPDGGDPDRPLAQAAYASAMAARGGWNSWLWLPEAFTLSIPVRVESAGYRHLLLAVDGAMAIPVFLHGGGPAFVLQTAGEVGYKSDHVAFGARLQLVWWAVDDVPVGTHFAQMSLEPFVRIDFGDPFLLARLTINLDEPWGFSFDDPDGGSPDSVYDDDAVWGLHLGVGTEF